jgi:hypothetical protein
MTFSSILGSIPIRTCIPKQAEPRLRNVSRSSIIHAMPTNELATKKGIVHDRRHMRAMPKMMAVAWTLHRFNIFFCVLYYIFQNTFVCGLFLELWPCLVFQYFFKIDRSFNLASILLQSCFNLASILLQSCFNIASILLQSC